ncbi:ribonuclease H-like domain-containing protein [Tanacetum coccineum]
MGLSTNAHEASITNHHGTSLTTLLPIIPHTFSNPLELTAWSLLSQAGIVKPIDRLSLHTSHLLYSSISPSNVNLLGVDFDETFSPVVKPAAIRNGFSLACLVGDYSQLDVKNAFLNRESWYGLNKHLVLGFSGLQAMPLGLDFLLVAIVTLQLLERAHMVNCNPSRTPVDTDSKLGPDGVPVQDPTLYRSLAGGLQYLTFTRPDLSYAVQQICLYMHDPREPHFAALKRILRYVQGTLDLGLHLYASATTSLVGYTDADWAGCPSTRRSTFGYCVFLGDNLLSWSAKRQHTISRSSAEAEYRGVANVVAETAWIRNLLRELHSPFNLYLVYDNVSAVYMSANPVQHQRTKHIEIDIHFVRDMVKAGHVRILHVPSRFQYADIFTKGLPSALFEDFRSSLSVRPPPAQSGGAYGPAVGLSIWA